MPSIQPPRFGLSRRAMLLIAGGFGVGLLLFLLLWMDLRNNGDFYRAEDKPAAEDGQIFEPLPSPMTREGRSASGLSEAAEEAAKRPRPAPPPVQPPAQTTAPDATSSTASAPRTPDTAGPVPMSRVQPDYPSDAMRRNESGKVVVRITVDADGRPDDVEVVRSSRSRALDRAALQAARRWRFRPAQANGRPVEGSVEVPFEFQLDGR